MGLPELIQQKAFLGKEFLTWLWRRAEEDPVIDLPGSAPCEVEILEMLVLDASFGDARINQIRGESPGLSPEAGAALMEGKKVRRARIRIAREGNDFTLVMDGETFGVSGLRLPATQKLPFDEAIGLRMEYAAEFDRLFTDLFQHFLGLRLEEKAWAGELAAMRSWVSAKGDQR